MLGCGPCGFMISEEGRVVREGLIRLLLSKDLKGMRRDTHITGGEVSRKGAASVRILSWMCV